MFLARLILYAVLVGKICLKKFPRRSVAGIDATYDGERCSMVTCLAVFASSGTSVTAVAPEPMTMIFLSL